MNMEKVERTVYHLTINAEHYYFGSLGALFSRFTKEQLGVAYGTLRNFKIEKGKPYQNNKCIIRKDILITSTTPQNTTGQQTTHD